MLFGTSGKKQKQKYRSDFVLALWLLVKSKMEALGAIQKADAGIKQQRLNSAHWFFWKKIALCTNQDKRKSRTSHHLTTLKSLKLETEPFEGRTGYNACCGFAASLFFLFSMSTMCLKCKDWNARPRHCSVGTTHTNKWNHWGNVWFGLSPRKRKKKKKF